MNAFDPSRHQFIKGMVADTTVAATGLGLSGFQRRSEFFKHGVASGAPLADRVIIWTRVSARDPGAGNRKIEAA